MSMRQENSRKDIDGGESPSWFVIHDGGAEARHPTTQQIGVKTKVDGWGEFGTVSFDAGDPIQYTAEQAGWYRMIGNTGHNQGTVSGCTHGVGWCVDSVDVSNLIAYTDFQQGGTGALQHTWVNCVTEYYLTEGQTVYFVNLLFTNASFSATVEDNIFSEFHLMV